MVLVGLILLLLAALVGCGDAPIIDRDASVVDGSMDSNDADGLDAGDEDGPCDAPVFYAADGQPPAALTACCNGKLCFGVCTSGSDCTCGSVSGGCAPQHCCTRPDAAPECRAICDGPTK